MDELGTEKKLLDDETDIICNKKQLKQSEMKKTLENGTDAKIEFESEEEYPEVWEELDEPLSKGMMWLDRHHNRLVTGFKNYTKYIKKGFLISCFIAFVVYFVFAMLNNYKDEGENVGFLKLISKLQKLFIIIL